MWLLNSNNFQDAFMAGGSEAEKWTLIIAEGHSAKSVVDAGLSEIGRAYYGVFSLKENLLNVRISSEREIMSNGNIQNLIAAIGLQVGVEYEDKKMLRYGRLMMMADQDHIGCQFKGLIINLLHTFWPNLIRMNHFITEFVTPIIKVTKDFHTLTFFTQQEYEIWRKETGEQIKSWKIKYNKGLGTIDNEEAKKYFSQLDKYTVLFRHEDEEDDKHIELAFAWNKAEDKKDWLNSYDENNFIDKSFGEISYKDFVNKELIVHSRFNCSRAIPSVWDGLKWGQRKILFTWFMKNLVNQIKVSRLWGYVTENSAYHFDERTLEATIVGMAQNFVGSNNINYLEPKGQFGTRGMGGKDPASSKYIFTCLPAIIKMIFHKQDKFLLKYLSDEGQSIEPEYYVPVIPMVLINGALGVWGDLKTFIPSYNPKEIIEALKDKMNGKEFKRLKPWYKNYTGDIEYQGNNFVVTGKFVHYESQKCLKITELPIGTWTREYKRFLDNLMEKDIITYFEEYHSTETVEFLIFYETSGDYFSDDETIIKQFRLSITLSCDSFVLYDKDKKLRSYKDETEILEEFYELRYEFYRKRRDCLIRRLQRHLIMLQDK